MAKIQSITVVTQQGVNQHKVGNTENGMKIHEIVDNSRDRENSTEFMYEGITEDGKYIFTLINAPVEIAYFKED